MDFSIIDEAVQRISSLRGTPHDAFVDAEWAYCPAGSIDLFQQFSDRVRAIRMTEGLLPVPGKWCINLYLIPRPNTEPFLTFLDKIFIPMPDGSAITPVCIRPGQIKTEAQVIDPTLFPIFQKCYVIQPQAYPRDHPEVIRKRDSMAGMSRN